MEDYEIFDAKIKYFNHKSGEWVNTYIKNIYDFRYDKNSCELIIKHIADVKVWLNSSYIVTQTKELNFSCGVFTKEQFRNYNLEIVNGDMVIKKLQKVSKIKRKYGIGKSFKSNSYKRMGGVKDQN